jgi:hypothetical protein
MAVLPLLILVTAAHAGYDIIPSPGASPVPWASYSPRPSESELQRAMHRAVHGPGAPNPCSSAPSGSPNPPVPDVPLDSRYFEDADRLTDETPYASRGEAERLPRHKRAFCARTENGIADSLDFLYGGAGSIYNWLAFSNPDGDFNTGLCWLHSRFQRSATYLAHFRPDRPRPSRAEAIRLIRRLAHDRDAVVEIPGFRNLMEFSSAYREELTVELNAMAYRAIPEGASRVGDASSTTAEDLRARMDQLYARRFEDRQIVFLRTKAAGMHLLSSHSWLLLDMEPVFGEPLPGNPMAATRKVGYRLKIIDPNYPTPVLIDYKQGDTALRDPRENKATLPYPFYDDDIPAFRSAIREYCR